MSYMYYNVKFLMKRKSVSWGTIELELIQVKTIKEILMLFYFNVKDSNSFKSWPCRTIGYGHNGNSQFNEIV